MNVTEAPVAIAVPERTAEQTMPPSAAGAVRMALAESCVAKAAAETATPRWWKKARS